MTLGSRSTLDDVATVVGSTPRRRRGLVFLSLSAIDACRDRLAAGYPWNDARSRVVAARIAARRRKPR